MMRVKQADLIRFETLQGNRAIGNPDTFVSEIYHPGLGLSGSFLGPGAREKRPVNEGELHFPSMVGNGDREETGVIVIHMDEIDAVNTVRRSPAPAVSSETNPPIPPGRSVGRLEKGPRKSSDSAGTFPRR